MKFHDPDALPDTAADSLRKDLGEKASIEAHLGALMDAWNEVDSGKPPLERAKKQLEIGRSLKAIDRGSEAWPWAREAFDTFAQNDEWEWAADACDVLSQCDQGASLAALGHGIWLAVTFPIDPDLTLALLQHLVDDTPDDSDGAAVAAATAMFIADVRTEGQQRKDLRFFASQLLGQVARRHSHVENQAQFQAWVERLELDQPDKFLVRLRNVVDVLVQEDWWIDRDAIHASLPDN